MITKKGTVVKKSGDKTIKVEINEYKSHSKYKKRFRVTKKILVHDSENTAKIGEIVQITQTSPVSKKKHWTLLKPKK